MCVWFTFLKRRWTRTSCSRAVKTLLKLGHCHRTSGSRTRMETYGVAAALWYSGEKGDRSCVDDSSWTLATLQEARKSVAQEGVRRAKYHAHPVQVPRVSLKVVARSLDPGDLAANKLQFGCRGLHQYTTRKSKRRGKRFTAQNATRDAGTGDSQRDAFQTHRTECQTTREGFLVDSWVIQRAWKKSVR